MFLESVITCLKSQFHDLKYYQPTLACIYERSSAAAR
jgi:hypothetical protein